MIVAPDFLRAAGEAGILFVAAEIGPGVNTHDTRLRVVQTQAGDVFSLVYRVVTARDEGTGETEAPFIRDRHGRPIPMVEGYAVRGRHEHLPVTDREWDRAHATLLASLQEFLRDESGNDGVLSSHAVPLGAAERTELDADARQNPGSRDQPPAVTPPSQSIPPSRSIPPSQSTPPSRSRPAHPLVLVLLGTLLLAAIVIGLTVALT
ncbi:MULTISPECIES: hypothetical protein [unclassified Frankia]|uniref:hypothetical protein n=1 Tax=unclassified Frankia TaxID=2632575 RepID=UPI00128F2EFA|nr:MULTISPECIES: hypothetical protein [unclassified Frankia]